MTTTVEVPGRTRVEQSRARYPDSEGYVERDGVRIFYEVYGDGEQTILLLPTWSLIHSRHWKAQIPYLARHFRVVTFDGRGNGRSDRPHGAEAYVAQEFAADALAVMDATGTDSALLVALSRGTHWATLLAADHPERVDGVVYIGSAVPHAAASAERAAFGFDAELDTEMAGRSSTATTGCGTTAASSSSSSERPSPSRTPPSRSRTASAGASTPTRRR